jgi:pyruvate formate lyase activating enzyme
MSKSKEMDILQSSASPEAIAQAAARHGCKSVAFTYNDPVIFYEYAVDTAIACQNQGIKTVAVTAGYVGETARPGFFKHIDAANVDLKGFSDRFYKELCGGELQPVLDTLKYLVHKTDVWVEITTLLIPGENDSDEELQAQCKWISEELGTDIPIHFSAFHPDFKMMTHPPTPLKTLQRAMQIASEAGIKYVYLGNVHDPDNTNTICSQCDGLLIGRSGYAISEWNLNTKGACAQCDKLVAGKFDQMPGSWGTRYERIRV